ncbi:hypothetical protein FRB93_007307 [Tulasnella sp. JGI-2019a]|nr:hypothetical protein FRB93_007307 [Tulasnella sp. JGI-2019a]
MIQVDPTGGNDRDKVFEAFQGAAFAFAVTVFIATLSKEKGIKEGEMYVDAAKHAKVKLPVWSGLEDMTGVTGGKYPLAHFDGKAQVTAYAKISSVPLVNVEAAMYMENYATMDAPRKQPDGSFIFFGVALPYANQTLLDTRHDYGLFVRKAIELPGLEELYAHGDVISSEKMAQQWGEITGQEVKYVQIPKDTFLKGAKEAGVPEPVAKELLGMHLAVEEFGYFGKKIIGPSLTGLARAPHTWAEFIKATDWSKIINCIRTSSKAKNKLLYETGMKSV